MRLISVLLCLITCGVANAAPQDFSVSVHQIANSSTPLPDEPELIFNRFPETPLNMTDDGLFFINAESGGFGNDSKGGVFFYSPDGDIQSIAKSRDTPFDSPTGFFDLYSDEQSSVFHAGVSSTEQSIWRINSDNTINQLIDLETTLPDGAGSASGIRLPRISADNVLFLGTGESSPEALYKTDTAGGPITTLINENTRPEFANTYFDIGDFQGDRFTFRTFDRDTNSSIGVYTSDLDGNVTEIAAIGDPVPNHEDEFFFRFSGGNSFATMDDDRIAFTGQGSGGTGGVYTTDITGDTLEVIADSTIPLPGDNGMTLGFSGPSISGDNVSFIGVGGSGRGVGLFVSVAGTIVDVIHKGDTLEGKTVDNILSGSFALHNNQVAFTIQFEDDSRGLYTANIIPAPGVAGVLTISGLWAIRRRRPRQYPSLRSAQTRRP